MKKDLILREKLAIQRTIMANQTTFLSFLRTAMYFLIAAITLKNVEIFENTAALELTFYVISCILFLFGMINFFIQRQIIRKSKIHIGDFKLEYETEEK
jgi:putative membrane protein